MKQTVIEKAKSFIYRNARPIDYARWNYHFENGSVQNVVTVLKCYQNEDGGFGHALEADCWNPKSSPVQTWCATEILRELFLEHNEHDTYTYLKQTDLVKAILQYLEKSIAMDGSGWSHTEESNNLYPHATWWEYPHSPWWSDTEEDRFCATYNPTAALAGFILLYGDKDSNIYGDACKIAHHAISDFLNMKQLDDMHVISCFFELLIYIKMTDVSEKFKAEELEKKLKNLVQTSITKDKEQWKTGYVCKPSQYIQSRESIFFEDNKEIANYECEFIENMQLEDGSWDVTWAWNAYPEEWAISKNWWKSDIIIKNCLYLQNIGGQEK